MLNGLKVVKDSRRKVALWMGYLFVITCILVVVGLGLKALSSRVYAEQIRFSVADSVESGDIASLMRMARKLSAQPNVISLKITQRANPIFVHHKDGMSFFKGYFGSSSRLQFSPYEISFIVEPPYEVYLVVFAFFFLILFSYLVFRSLAKIEGRELQSILNSTVTSFAHDVRKPLREILESYSKAGLGSEKFVSSFFYLQGLADDLLSKRRLSQIDWINIDHETQTTYIPAIELIGLTVSWRNKVGPINVSTSRVSLMRLIHNFVQNSREVGASHIALDFCFKDGNYVLSLQDDGCGFSAESLAQIGKNAFSTKSGEGIGLLNSVQRIGNFDSRVQFCNGLTGARMEITFYKCKIINIPGNASGWCLIDDDKYVRNAWREAAISFGLDLKLYESYKEFIVDQSNLESSRIIFIDSFLGNEKGEEFAAEIACLGFKDIYLVTEGFTANIEDYPALTGILPKDFPSYLMKR